MKKDDKVLLNSLNDVPNTKKMLKRQKKLDNKDHIAQNQRSDLLYLLTAYVLSAIFILITCLLWHYYMIPYWDRVSLSHIDNWQNAWTQIKAFFMVHKDMGATWAIVFMVFSALGTAYIILGGIKFFFKCLTNIWMFKSLYWFLLMLFAWIPVINVLVMWLALRKYAQYTKLKIANQAKLSTAMTLNTIQQNPQILNQQVGSYNGPTNNNTQQ